MCTLIISWAGADIVGGKSRIPYLIFWYRVARSSE